MLLTSDQCLQNSNPNTIDDFLGRSSWSKMQQQNRSQASSVNDNSFMAHLQQQQQQQQLQQNYSKMMGLMSLGKTERPDDFDHSSFSETASSNYSVDPLTRGGSLFGTNYQSGENFQKRNRFENEFIYVLYGCRKSASLTH